MTNQTAIRNALRTEGEIYKYEGNMLAECPFTGTFGFLNVLQFGRSHPSEYAGQLVYVSDAGVEEIEADIIDTERHISEAL